VCSSIIVSIIRRISLFLTRPTAPTSVRFDFHHFQSLIWSFFHFIICSAYHFHGPSIGNPSPAQVGTPIGSVSAKISHTIALPASAQKSDTQKSAAVKKSATEHAKMNSNPVLKAQKNKLSTQTIRNQMGLSNSIVMTPVIPGNRPLIGANMGVGSIGTIINMSNWHLPFNDSTGDADYGTFTCVFVDEYRCAVICLWIMFQYLNLFCFCVSSLFDLL
jgi:hypothetical protein